jgi:hypothetical protein
MHMTVDLRQMSLPDKLRLMEELWRDLSQNESNVPSPEWHGTILEDRERKLASGEDKLVDWDDAKRQLRSKLQ